MVWINSVGNCKCVVLLSRSIIQSSLSKHYLFNIITICSYTGSPEVLSICSMMVWSYNTGEKKWLVICPWSCDHCTTPMVTSQFGCLTIDLYLQWLQHPLALWSWIATFPADFWQAKSVRKTGLHNESVVHLTTMVKMIKSGHMMTCLRNTLLRNQNSSSSS